MPRVVVTGIGLTSPLGCIVPTISTFDQRNEVLRALLMGTTAVTADSEYEANGFKSRVSARVPGFGQFYDGVVTRSGKRFNGKGKTIPLGQVAAYGAVADAGLADSIAGNPNVGAILGTGGPSTEDQVATGSVIGKERWHRAVGPFAVPPAMSSGLHAVVCTTLGIQGPGFGITSACATSAHGIGEAFMMIVQGRAKVMIAGGADDCHPTKAAGFDALGALSTKYNDTPGSASRPFDNGRDGFVEAEGGGVVVLEELEHARKRGAHIYAEIVGYGLSMDGASMVEPSGEGALRAIRQARAMAPGVVIDYVNTHGTSTKKGDVEEIKVLSKVFRRRRRPLVTSTKALTGHSLGGAGATELIYTILMLNAGCVGPAINIDELDPEIAALGWDEHIPREARECKMRGAMSNSFGFGGVNAVLIVKPFALRR